MFVMFSVRDLAFVHSADLMLFFLASLISTTSNQELARPPDVCIITF